MNPLRTTHTTSFIFLCPSKEYLQRQIIMPTLNNKYFAVTGAASGIGQATVLRLVKLGASGIAISDVDEKGLAETAKLCT